ncbi:uncharacterized protein AKAME5_001650400 [Lates japonicus]|uniref:Ig-like domain-containing protein n=1 Tax=Lates japonicus TaxID=270547 RepID=A0AAD3N379_LATJO|nr:uncharacterized protein AKAME5_001650400 [Lates japonicus]
MGVTALHILLLVHAFTLTTQEWVTLSVSPKITAECGKPVTLQCKATEEPYGCKLRSNQGVQYKTTAVELQECCAKVEGDLTSDGPICTFSNVYPDGDVHWFHGSHYLSDRSTERKRVSKGGWLTVHSHLKRKSSDVPYNCSLWSNKSDMKFESLFESE